MPPKANQRKARLEQGGDPMERRYPNGRMMILIAVAGLTVLVGCAGVKTTKKSAASNPAATIAEPTPQAITTGDIAVWSRDEKMLDGAWMQVKGMKSAKKITEGITFDLMATDRSQKPLKPAPAWRVSDPTVASVSPATGEMVTLTVLKAGKASITVSSGNRKATLVLEANPEGANLRF
jgi:hypothetical protein